MAKFLLLKHYPGGPAPVNDVPMDQWTPEELSAHVQYMEDFAARLEGTGEFVDGQALSPEGTFVRYDGEGRSPVTDGTARNASRASPSPGRGRWWTTRSSCTSCARTRPCHRLRPSR